MWVKTRTFGILFLFILSILGSASGFEPKTRETSSTSIENVEIAALEVKVADVKDVHEGRKARERLEMQINAPTIIKKIKMTAVKKETLPEQTTKISSTSLETTTCHVAQSEYAPARTFDCSEGIAMNDDKETSLRADRGKKYAYLETSFDIPEQETKTTLRVVHDAEFPTQQDISIYYRDPETKTWKLACHNLKEGTQYCDVTPAAQAKKAEFRIEAYAREGKSQWSVNNVALLQEKQEDVEEPIGLLSINLLTASPTVPQCYPSFCPPTTPTEPTPGEIITTLARGTPLAKSPPQSTPSISFSGNPIPSSTANDVIIPEVQENPSEPSPITAAAVGNVLSNNKAGVGLLLLFMVIVGTMAYRARSKKRK
ncbi:MAG: hypothetical protein AABX72_02290 [Nanoarchaeota archaeon]